MPGGTISRLYAIGKQQPTRIACDFTADRTFPRSIARVPAGSERAAGIIDSHYGICEARFYRPFHSLGQSELGAMMGFPSAVALPLMGMTSIETNLRSLERQGGNTPAGERPLLTRQKRKPAAAPATLATARYLMPLDPTNSLAVARRASLEQQAVMSDN